MSSQELSKEEEAEDSRLSATLKKEKKKSKKSKKKSKKSKKDKKGSKRREREQTSPEANELDNATQSKKRKGDDGNSVPKNPAHVDNFPIHPSIKAALAARGITELFPIQCQTYNQVYEGNDLLGRARTGTGKTFAFALPVLSRLMERTGVKKRGRAPKVIVVTPTRELALQVHREFDSVSVGLDSVCIYGGAPYAPQERALRNGVDIVVSTVGRVLDHLERGTLRLTDVEFAILDEADEMLNMGFADDVQKILGAIPPEQDKQVLLFSATLPAWVLKVAKQYLSGGYVRVDLVTDETMKTAAKVSHKAICCSWQVRGAVLSDVIRVYGGTGKSIVFCNTKKEANDLALNSSIRNECEVLHGDIAQEQREVTTQGFRDGRFQCLIATDVAARGIDIDDVDLVVQTEPPRDGETYIHRSGRTGRAGRSGTCILFYQRRDAGQLKRLERQAGFEFERIGTPQPVDVVRAAGKSATTLLGAVDACMVPYFEDTAKVLIEEYGSEHALALALAQITGHTKMFKSRSLLSSLTGYTTVMHKSSRPVNSPMHILNMLKSQLGEDKVNKVRDISLLADRSGAVADVPEDYVDTILETSNSWNAWEVCTELPELAERPQRGSGGGRGGFRRGSGGWGGRGQRGRGGGGGRGGGFRRGYGGGGRGGGGRGGGGGYRRGR